MQTLSNSTLRFFFGENGRGGVPGSFGVYTFDSEDNVLVERIFRNIKPGDVFDANFSEGQNVAFWFEFGGVVTDLRSVKDGGYSGALMSPYLFRLAMDSDDGAETPYGGAEIFVAPKNKTTVHLPEERSPLLGAILTALLVLSGFAVALYSARMKIGMMLSSAYLKYANKNKEDKF